MKTVFYLTQMNGLKNSQLNLQLILDINLTKDHWLVIDMIRDQYENSMRVPELRHILKSMKLMMGEAKATRKFVYTLFPYGYGQQGCLIAGMRQPKKLWLDL